MGAVSFDSMYSPLILARTGNSEMAVGTISAFMAAGCLAASIMLTVMKQPKRKLSMMYVGSFMCLTGITLFGMGRNMGEWCAIVFFGCFGSPIYSTYQTIILREKVPTSMQGRIFSLQGMITGMLAPVGYLAGALLADYICEPFMQKNGKVQQFLSVFVGCGKGAGMIGEIVKVIVDRPLGSYHPKHKDMYYPVNYGYIEGIMAPDDEEQDAYIIGVNEAVKEFTGKIIAIVHRLDDIEEKWVVAPEGVSYTKKEIFEFVKFQEQYFRSEIKMRDGTIGT